MAAGTAAAVEITAAAAADRGSKQIESMHGRRALREGRAPLLSACAAGQLEVSEWNSMQSPKRMIAFL